MSMRPFWLAVLCTLGPSALTAQVGHDPARSPYRDVGGSTFITLFAGQFFGDGGTYGVAPHNGQTYGLHINLMANRPVQINAGIIYGDLERLLLDPRKPVGERSTGPVPNSVLWIDTGVQFNLTGNKTWHGLAPYTGVMSGLAFVESAPEDPGLFKMGTTFVLSPMIGTRYFLGRSVHLLAEARFQFWQVKYPTTYGGVGGQWLLTPWVQLGLGFPFPF
jgi:hypothetical protein